MIDLGLLGTNNSKTAGTTLAITNSTGAIIPAGTFMVLAFTCDNPASTSAPTITPSNSGGSAWNQRGSTTGSGVTTTAGSGIWGAVFTTKTVSDIAAGATITTITHTSVVARIALIEGFSGVNDTLRNTVASGTSTAGTPSATTTGTALVAGDLVIGTIHGENNANPAGDADTTNGSWDTIVAAATTGGGAATNVCVGTQDKEVTATGAQTFNATTSADSVAFVMAFTPAPQDATATPSVVAATTAVATVNPVVKAVTVAAVTAIATLTGNIVPNLAAAASIPTPTISDGSSSATATPSVVAATTSIPTPAVATGSATATPSRVSAAATIPTPSVQGNPTWFTDSGVGGSGSPLLLVSAEDWGLLANGGLQHAGDFAATYDDYFSHRQAQGYNSILVSLFSFAGLSGGANGPDSDGTYPFNTNSTNPSNTANTTFWARRDAFLSTAASYGFYVMLNVSTPWVHIGSFTASWTSTQWTNLGTFLGNRYASQPNILWMLGDDYFDDIDSGFDAFLSALRTAGATQPITIQNYQETTSRKDIFNGGTRPWGNTNAQYNFGYSYNVWYDVVEKMGNESNPLPYFAGDGTFLNTGGITGLTDVQLMRRHIWWALSSGSKGFQVGDNDMWPWDSTALGFVTSKSFYTSVVPAIASYFRTLPNWHTLKADTSSVLVTGGRGTHATALTSGGSGGQYLSDSDSYVTASRTPDGSLAVIYMSHGSTITIDQSQMVAGYVATWVDPKTCATSSATPGSTYNSTAKGNNSDGQADWVLVLQAPTGVTVTPSVVSATTTVPAAAPQTGATVSPTVVSATATVPSPALHTGETVTASVVNATTSITTPTVTSRATVSPAVVSVAASVASPSVGAGATATPVVVATVAAIPTPSVSTSGNATATPTVVAATASIPAPTVTTSGNATVTPTVVAGTSTVAAPSVATGETVAASGVNGAVSIPTPTITSRATATPTVVAAVTTIPVPAVSAGGNSTVSAATVSGAATVAQPTVRTGSTITPTRVSAVTTVPTATVTSPAAVSTSPVNATTSIPTPSISVTGNAQVQPETVAATASIPTPAVISPDAAGPTPAVRRLPIAAEPRTLQVEAEGRRLSIPTETRTHVV